MKLRAHSRTSTVAPLKFGDGYLFWPHILCWKFKTKIKMIGQPKQVPLVEGSFGGCRCPSAKTAIMIFHYSDVIKSTMASHRRLDRLPKGLFKRRSKKTANLRVTTLCEGNSPVTGEFPAQMAINAENIFIWWRHHAVVFIGPGNDALTNGR